MKPLKLKPLRRVAIFSALVFLSLAGVPWRTGPLVHGVPLNIVNVSAPAINCKFAVACVITVTDTADHFVLAGSSGDAFLQSRTFSGEPGTVAAGLFGYEYRIDLTNLSGITFNPCVTSFTIEFGPVVSLDYNDVPDGILDDVYVVTAGGLGTVAPSLADKVGDAITFRFDDPPVCAGQTTFFFGLASAHPPRFVTAQLKDLQAAVYNLQARAPDFVVPKPLDHFKCYVTQGTQVGETVVLGDQFANSTALVLQAIRFCNSVEKIHGDRVIPIEDQNAHLKLYAIQSSQSVTGAPVSRPREVVVRNQFGDQHLRLFGAVVLAVPTQKLEPTFHPPPRALDHFKCYSARGESVEAVVGLRDEFHSEPTVAVLNPILFCNPAVKVHRDIVTPILNPKDHLTCYRIRGGGFQGFVFARNQFGSEALTVGSADILCVPSEKGSPPSGDPNIQKMCGERAVVDFDGGNVLPGGPGTGLYRDNPSVLWPDGQPHRPCGRFVPIDGFLPSSSNVVRFRVAYRPAGDPVPPAGTALGIQTHWKLWNWDPFLPGCRDPRTILNPLWLNSTIDGWINAEDYLDAKNGALAGLTNGCSNSGLRLAVWDTNNELALGLGPADPNGHYVVWLEWVDTFNVPHKELTEHHIQLDNTLSLIKNLLITLSDDTTPVPACGKAEPGNIFKVYGDFYDKYYWYFQLTVYGGSPPASYTWPAHHYYDPWPNTDTIGTIPFSSTVFLQDIDMTVLGKSFTDCCYLLFLRVWDAAIRHTFDYVVANDTGFAAYTEAFTTFAASPGP